jgi:hypothetical protein
MKHGPDVWVVCRRGRFTIDVKGRGKNIILPRSQREAVKIARGIAQANNSELIVQGTNGRIRAKDSHGFDSFPPRG